METEFKKCGKCGHSATWVGDIKIKYTYEGEKGIMNKRTMQCGSCKHTFTINYEFTPFAAKN